MNVIVFGTGSSLQHEIEEEFRANGHEVTSSMSRIKIPNRFYDVAVDTSARGMSDMRLVVQALKDKTSHYILISSYKVYPSIPRVIPWHTGDIDLCDESGVEALNRTVREYRAVERELQMHFPLSMEWTILRPAIVEEKENPEPNNMSWFVNRILDGGPIVFPDNDDLLFRHISSNDLARAVCLIAKREEAFSQMIHLASNALLSFESYARMLMKCLGQEVPIVRVSKNRWDSSGLVLPMGEQFHSSFIDTSLVLDGIGWQPTDEIKWVSEYSKFLKGSHVERPKLRDAELALADDRPKEKQIEMRPVSGWRLVGAPGRPYSFCFEWTSEKEMESRPLLKTVKVAMGAAEEHLLVEAPSEAGSRIVGHNALLELLDAGESGLSKESLYLAVPQRPCGTPDCSYCLGHVPGLAGVDDDGFATDLVTLPPEHLIPVPDGATGFALLADPLARLLFTLSSLLAEGTGPVWVYGRRVETVLAGFLVLDSRRELVHVDRTNAVQGIRPFESSRLTISKARESVKSGALQRPEISVNVSGCRDGENSLLPSLVRGGTIVTPFSRTGAHSRTKRLHLPSAAPGRKWLERALELLEQWSDKRELELLLQPVALENFWEMFLLNQFQLPYIDLSGDHK